MDLETYNKSRDEYYRRKNLPFFHPDRVFNMSCWLKLYQMCDVVPLVTAIKNQFTKFWELFGIDSNCYNSLPGIALDAMFQNFDQDMPYCFSCHSRFPEIRELFRKYFIGGLTTCFCRHVDLSGGSDSPVNARHLPNGDPGTAVTVQDVNR